MKKNLDYYDGLPWRVIIDPERQDDGQIIFVASHPEFDGVLGTGETPEAALADLHAARRSRRACCSILCCGVTELRVTLEEPCTPKEGARQTMPHTLILGHPRSLRPSVARRDWRSRGREGAG